jgi:hypothetical protein
MNRVVALARAGWSVVAAWAGRTSWWVRGTWLVALVNAIVGAMVASLAAVLGLIAGDLLPPSGSAHTSTVRVVVFVLALGGLYGAILLRGWVQRATGTLFYVRILDDVMVDWHAEPLGYAHRRRMSLRSVTRWVDLTAQTTTAAEVIDISPTCTQIGEALEAVINGDRDDTAYVIAPNMPWQAALAVGAELPIVDRLHLLELPGRPPEPGRGPAPPARASAVLLKLPFPTANRPEATWWTHDIDEEPDTLPHPAPDGARVGLLLAFTKAAGDPSMQPAKVFAGLGVAKYHRLRPITAVGISDGRLTSRQLATLAPALCAAVAYIKKQAGTRELVVAAALPKILATALGWGLAQSDCRFFTGTYLLHYHLPAGPFQPIRVHPSQPTTPPQ